MQMQGLVLETQNDWNGSKATERAALLVAEDAAEEEAPMAGPSLAAPDRQV